MTIDECHDVVANMGGNTLFHTLSQAYNETGMNEQFIQQRANIAGRVVGHLQTHKFIGNLFASQSQWLNV